MIRRAHVDELEAVAALVSSLQSRPEDRNAFFGVTVDEAGALLSSWETPWVEASVVAERGGQIVGILDSGELAGYAAGRIDEAAVAALTRALAERAPITKVSLTVSTQNDAALAPYDRLGFSRASSAVGYRRQAERCG